MSSPSTFVTNSNSNTKSKSTADYYPPLYDNIDIEYLKGYNRGDARFLNLVKGTYILKIKPQKINKDTSFIVNYACEQKLKVK